MLFCHGAESAGLATIDEWRTVLRRARIDGSFAGVSPDPYPHDLAAFFRYHRAMRRIPARQPMPGPLPLDQFDEFYEQHRSGYPLLMLLGS